MKDFDEKILNRFSELFKLVNSHVFLFHHRGSKILHIVL